MEKKAIIFDLDGTLWEVIDSTYESANKVTNKYHLKEVSKETVCSVFGKNKVDSARGYFPYLELNQSLKLMEEIAFCNIDNLMEKGGNVYPNLEETLLRLKEKYELFIVSNTAQIEYIEAFLISSNLKKYFTDYIAASALGISKEEAIQKIIRDYQLRDSIYVGDTIQDRNASKLVGVPFIQARYGFGENLKTEYYLDEIKELPDVVEKIYSIKLIEN